MTDLSRARYVTPVTNQVMGATRPGLSGSS